MTPISDCGSFCHCRLMYIINSLNLPCRWTPSYVPFPFALAIAINLDWSSINLYLPLVEDVTKLLSQILIWFIFCSVMKGEVLWLCKL